MHFLHVFQAEWNNWSSPDRLSALTNFEKGCSALLEGNLRQYAEVPPETAAFYTVTQAKTHGHGIAEYCRSVDADLVVLGNRGRTTLKYILLGSTAERFDDPDEALEALWHTEEVRERRVGPLQEVENAVFYFDRTLFDTAANFCATFDAELAVHYPTVKRRRPFLTFASWVGGDRDGNPFVTPEISRTTAQWHACAAMDFYERQCALLLQEITHTSPPARLPARNEPADGIIAFQPYEAFRVKLARLRGKLRAVKGEE